MHEYSRDFDAHVIPKAVPVLSYFDFLSFILLPYFRTGALLLITGGKDCLKNPKHRTHFFFSSQQQPQDTTILPSNVVRRSPNAIFVGIAIDFLRPRQKLHIAIPGVWPPWTLTPSEFSHERPLLSLIQILSDLLMKIPSSAIDLPRRSASESILL